jgi:plastocyanin
MITLMKRALAAAFLIVPVVAHSDTDAKIGIDNFKFGPVGLTISKGTAVTWTNDDDIPHSVVFTGLGVKSKTLDTEGVFTYQFDKAGTFAYICGLHPFMKGTVTVR